MASQPMTGTAVLLELLNITENLPQISVMTVFSCRSTKKSLNLKAKFVL